MNAVTASLVVTACVFAGGMFGLNAHRFLPERHLTKDTLEVIRLGTGTISVLASLVLGLLIATAKTSSDTTDRELRSYAADLIILDSTLRHFGAAAAVPRALLRRSTQRMLQDIWPSPGGRFAGIDDASAGALLDQMQQAVHSLGAVDADQRLLRDQALQTAAALLRQRWLLIEQTGPSVQPVVLTILVLWVVAIFASFGLSAPRNGTVIAAFFLCALAIGGAVFLVLELDSPLSGVLRISERPMLRALAQMGG